MRSPRASSRAPSRSVDDRPTAAPRHPLPPVRQPRPRLPGDPRRHDRRAAPLLPVRGVRDRARRSAGAARRPRGERRGRRSRSARQGVRRGRGGAPVHGLPAPSRSYARRPARAASSLPRGGPGLRLRRAHGPGARVGGHRRRALGVRRPRPRAARCAARARAARGGASAGLRGCRHRLRGARARARPRRLRRHVARAARPRGLPRAHHAERRGAGRRRADGAPVVRVIRPGLPPEHPLPGLAAAPARSSRPARRTNLPQRGLHGPAAYDRCRRPRAGTHPR